VFFGTILGSFLVYIFSNLIGKPSQKFGLPFVVLLRSSLGFNGAKYLGLLRALVGIFMFGVQTYIISKAFGYLIRILIFTVDSSLLSRDIFSFFLIGIDFVDWVSFSAVIIFQTLMFSVGINFNKRLINYSAITVYLGMIIFFFGVLLSDVKLTSQAFVELLDYKNLLYSENIFALLSVAGAIFTYFSIIIVSFGDFSRYVKNESELKKGNLSLIANLIIFSFFSVFIVIGSDVFLNLRFLDLSSILTNPTDIVGKFDNTSITVIAIFFIIISSASTNLVANFIPSQYSLINFLPNSLNLKSASYLILIASFLVGIFWLTVLSQIGVLSFVDTLSSFFGPLFGVMIADYYLINSKSISNKDIYSTEAKSIYYFSKGWHIKGLYSMLIGFIFSASSIWNPNLMFLQSFAWIIGAIISLITYYLLTKK
jgi:NCS1 family nucleobase:cation symporter-1